MVQVCTFAVCMNESKNLVPTSWQIFDATDTTYLLSSSHQQSPKRIACKIMFIAI
jgi:hypothetical protein